MPLGAFKAVVTSKAAGLGAAEVLNAQCLTLDGTGDAVSFGDNHDPGTSDFTWEGWARSTAAVNKVLANKRPSGGAGANNGVTWVILGAGGSDPFLDDGGGNFVRVTAGSGFNDGLWHHHAFTWDSSTGTLRSYADGALLGTSVNAAMIGANFNNGTLFRVGSDPVPANFFNGEIDEVRIWSRLRTLQEIRDNRFRQIAPATTNLVGYYRFEGNVVDLTSTGADGTLIGDAAATAVNPPFRHNDAYSVMLQELAREDASPDKMTHWVLDEETGVAAFSEGLGSGDEFPGVYTNGPTLADLALLGLRGFKGALFDRDSGNQIVNGVGLTPLGTTTNATWSVAVWFRMSATAIGTGMKFFDQRESAGTNTNASAGLDSSGQLQIVTGSDVPNGLSAGTVLEEERIYCAIYTHDAPSQRRRLYVNGVLDGSDSGARNYTGGANGMFSIGRRPGTLNDQFMKGNIMDVSVFRGVELTADQAEMVFLVGSAGRFKDVVLDDVPTSYWRLDETSGTVAKDQQGANAGTYVSAPILGAASLIPGGGGFGDERELGKAVTFDGSVEHVTANGVASVFDGVSSVSISFWLSTTSSVQGIVPVAPGDSGGGNGLFTVQLNQRHTPSPVLDTNAIEITRRSTGGTLEDANFNTGGAHRDGNPHHYAVTYDGSDMRLYFDGLEVASFATTLNIGPMDRFAIAGLLRASFILGVPGTFDEVAVYPFALSADRVRAQFLAGVATTLYGATVGATGPVAYFKLDESTGADAFDEAGVFDAIYTSGPTLGQPSLIQALVDATGKSVSFDGVNDGVVLPSVPIGTGDFSNFGVEAWLKPNALTLANIYNHRSGGNDTNLALVLQVGGLVEFDKNPVSGGSLLSTVTALAVGEVAHLAYVEEGADQTWYLDGALDASAASAETFSGGAMTAAAIARNAQSAGSPYSGLIDELAIYAHSPSRGHIEAHFRVGR
ncbi:hypothetical protein LCGC14_0631360 [marine sediment metagenome]|uniref:LamG-like jellyroll fold domain-containing protein n=1 Tax=marine sediment metagenome TaxID=412755 RepID=A0A0F9TNB7_9ZZZZ